MNLISIIKLKLVNRSFESKIKYLRSKGVVIGDKTRLLCNTNAFGSEPYLISVGENCLFSNNVNIFTHDGGVKVLNALHYFDGIHMDKVAPVTIGNNCFIGNGTKIMPGVTIGDNVIIGAGSIVTKDIASDSVVAGIPAKVICSIDAYYLKNKDNFYPTGGLSYEEKKKILQEKINNA